MVIARSEPIKWLDEVDVVVDQNHEVRVDHHDDVLV